MSARCKDAESRIHLEQLHHGLNGNVDSPLDEDVAASLSTKVENFRKNRCKFRERFRRLVRDEVLALVGDPALVDDEIRRLRDAL